MFSIDQRSREDKHKVKELLGLYGDIRIQFIEELVDIDINYINELESKAKNEINRINLKNIRRYLKGIKSRASRENIHIMWTYIRKKIGSVPIELRKIDGVGVDTTKYIKISEGKSLVSIDYMLLLDLIVFEIAHRDLGYDMSEVEQILYDVSTIGIHEISTFYTEVYGSYHRAMGLLIEDSPYASWDKKYITNYFGVRIEKTDKYRDIIESTIWHLSSILLAYYLGQIKEKKMNIEIVGIFEHNISLLVKDEDLESLLKIVSEEVAVRIFGRIFGAYSVIQVNRKEWLRSE